MAGAPTGRREEKLDADQAVAPRRPSEASRRQRLQMMGMSTDSCYSVCDFYDEDFEVPSAISVSAENTASGDAIGAGGCACSSWERCCCGVVTGPADSTSVLPVSLCVSTDTDNRQLENALPDENKSHHDLDTKEILGIALQQARQLLRAGPANSSMENCRRFTQLGECQPTTTTDLCSDSESHADLNPVNARTSQQNMDDGRGYQQGIVQSTSSDSDSACSREEWEEKLEARRPSASVSVCSECSDVSIQELELETTGDFPSHYQFRAAARDAEDQSGGAVSCRADGKVSVIEGSPPEAGALSVDTSSADTQPRSLLSSDANASGNCHPHAGFADATKTLLDHLLGVCAGIPLEEAPTDQRGSRPHAHTVGAAYRTRETRADVDGPIGNSADTCRRCAQTRRRPMASRYSDHQRSRSLDDRPQLTDQMRLSQELLKPLRPIGGGDETCTFQSSSCGSNTDFRSGTAQCYTKTAEQPHTIQYVVRRDDTIASISAHFCCLPAELAQLNRLATRLLICGQVLLVPSTLLDATEQASPEHDGPMNNDAKENVGMPDQMTSTSPKHSPDPYAVVGASWRRQQTAPEEQSPLKYVDIKARLITNEKGYPAGTLLLTPNRLMFEPHVCDPLVVEFGVDAYSITLPVEYLVSADYYRDLPHWQSDSAQSVELYPEPVPCGATSSLEHLVSAPGDDTTTDADSQLRHPSWADELTGHDIANAGHADVTTIGSRNKGGATTAQTSQGNQPFSLRDDGRASPSSRYLGRPSPVKSPPVDIPVTAGSDGGRVSAGGSSDRWSDSAKDRHSSALSARRARPVASEGFSVPPPLEVDCVSPLASVIPFVSRSSATRSSWASVKSDRSASLSFSRDESKLISPGHDHARPASSGCDDIRSASTGHDDITPASTGGNDTGSASSGRDDPGPASLGRDDAGSASLSGDDTGSGSAVPGAVGFCELSGDHQEAGKPCQGLTNQREDVGSKTGVKTTSRRWRSAISMDERPSLFMTCDELLRTPMPSLGEPLLYLRLVTGIQRGCRVPRTERIRVCGERRLRSQLWFATPRDSCVQLNRFIQHWIPEISGRLESTDMESRGYQLVDSDCDICDSEEDWEMVNVTGIHGNLEQLQHTSEEPCASPSQDSASLDMACIPDLIGKSDLLSTDIRSCLCMVLPARVEGHPWSLIFNTAEHGFSLKSLYRKALAFECPMLLVVHDSNDKIFGALSTDPIRMKPYYYGTGESFLFTFHQQFRVFRWSGENAYFARGHLDGLQFGSGEGRSGLHLDEGLYHGYTESCLTYRNRPLTSTRNFTIKAVELWALS